ncbi:MAG: glycosyltransferase, partial [Planctomycetales bacterium]|nr:glycosyltransferase [Planctomycetales bacterium]
MKLLVITMLYEPDFVGIAAIASDLCHELAERGHDVTVYTAYPYYPEWRRKSDANPWSIQEELLGKVKVRRHGLYLPNTPSKLLPRVVHELSFPLSLSRSLFHGGRYDAVMVFCPLLGSVVFSALRKLLRREPLWLNVQDLPAEAGRATGIIGGKGVHWLGRTVQRLLFSRAELWSSISPEMVETLRNVAKPSTQLHLCPNWLIGPLADQVAKLPCKCGRPVQHPLKLLYSGTIGKKQSLVPFCRELAKLNLEFQFRICCEGSESRPLRNWARETNDPRFQVTSLLPDDQFVKGIHDADLFVITEMQGAGASFLPSKLIPCISTGTPVLAIADRSGPLGSEIAQHGIGLGVEWSELSTLPARLEQLMNSPDLLESYQRNCLARAESYQRGPAIDLVERI